MMSWRPRMKKRRGGTLSVAVVSLVMSLTTLGVEMDAGRLYVVRHQDQIIADSATLAGATKIPHGSDVEAAANLIVSKYESAYTEAFTPAVALTTNANGFCTGVRVTVGEDVPMFLPSLMGATTRPVSTHAAATGSVAGALSAGVVPLGVQYNTTFSLPTNGYASNTVITLKQASLYTE